MSSVETFVELVNAICLRRHMYVAGGTFYEVCAYLGGYSHASPDCPLGGEGWVDFNEFVCATLRCPSKIAWPYVLRQCSLDDDEATARLHRLLTEFAARTKTESRAKIVRDAVSRARDHEEGEPVKAWRRFSRAIHRANKEEIESLIQDHPDADVLWSASYPDGAVPLLDQIEESYLISPVAGSEEGGQVTILTPNFGLVDVKRIGGIWRIDASQIINRWKLWKANRNESPKPPVGGG
jgi:hypothetical protein